MAFHGPLSALSRATEGEWRVGLWEGWGGGGGSLGGEQLGELLVHGED